MAKVISDELMKLKVIVNGDEAQKEILDLESANKTLSLRIKDLSDKQKELSKQRKQDTAEYKANKAEIERLTISIADNKKKIDEQIKSMDNSRLTMEQLRKKAQDLKLTMNNMNPNSADFKRVQGDLKGVESRMLELRNGAKASGTSISSLADKFNQYSGIATAVIATMAGVALSVQGVIDYNNKLVDAQTKVGKATGMTNEEVKELTKSFSEFKTRTSNMDLLKIAEVGGKLGVPKAEIKAFTQEVDKAFVALGDNFSGGVEAVANKLGKLKGIFKETKDQNVADAINDIGSALNELDNQGTASAENVSDFALRVGTLPEKLKPSIAETLGLGAAFEESGLNAERASSGYNKFVRVAATETKKFAEVMRISEEEVKKLINQDTLQFFLKFAEGAKGLDATEVSKMLEFLKLNDAEVISVIGAASESTDRFRKSIETSNQALAEGTSLQTEFNRVNTNTAAIFEKVKKSIVGAFSSETIAKGLNMMISAVANLLGVGNEAEKKTSLFRRTLSDLFAIVVIGVTAFVSVSTAIAVYNNLIKDSIVKNIALDVIEKARNVRLALSTTLQTLWNGSIAAGSFLIGKLTGLLGFSTVATNLQTAAQTRWNLAMAANPIGAVIALVTALAAATYLLYKRNQEATKSKREFNDAMLEGKKNAISETNALDQAYKKLVNKNIEEKERIKILDDLKSKYPGYFDNLKTEDFLVGKAAGAYNKLKQAIIDSAKAKAAQNKIDQISQTYLDEEEAIRKRMEQANIDYRNAKDETVFIQGSGMTGGGTYQKVSKSENQASAKARFQAETENLKNLYKQRNKDLEPYTKIISKGDPLSTSTNSTTSESNYKTDFGSTSSSSSKNTTENKVSEFQKLQNRMLDEIEKANQLEIDLEIDKQETLANLKNDWYQRELLEILAAEDRKKAELDKKRISDDEFTKLDEIIAKSKGAEKTKFEALKEQWIENNASLDKLKLLAAETTAFKIGALNQKAQQEAFKKQEEQLSKNLENYKNLTNQALAENTTVEQQKMFLASLGYSDDSLRLIRTWEEGRKEIEKYYQQKALEDQVIFLQTKIAEYNAVMATMPMSFSPEQLDQIEKYKQKITELLAEIQKLKNGESGNNSKEKADFSSLTGGGSTDILGLNEDQWKAMFTKTDDLATNIKKIGLAVQVAQQMYAQFYSFQQANMQAELRRYEVNSDRKKRRLKAELDAGYINQETYKKLTLQADEELDRKKAEIEYKQAKRQRDMQIAQTIANTAMAIMGIWADFPKADFGITATIMSGVVGALGALQVATIMRQPLPEVPGAEDGYYPTIRQQDGKMFNARRKSLRAGLYSEPTVLVGEGNKTELVVDSKTLKRINPTIQQEYMREIQRVKGYETGMIPNSNNSSDEILIKAMQVMENVNQSLETLSKFGVIARWENLYKAVEQIEETKEERNRIIEKNKR